MASSYVNDLRLNEMATGDASGTWGTTTNTNLELIAEAFSYGTEVITTNADTHTTTIADGATDPGRALYLKYTGTLDSACTITIGPNTVSKVWIIENGTSGSQDIIISQGSGANITIPAGDTKVVYSDGAGAGAAFFDAFASLSVVDLKVQDDLTVTGDIDVDGTTNLDIVDIDGAVNMATTALVTGVLTTTATQVATGGITSGSDIISDTDSTDSLGSTGVRWLKGWFDTLTAGTLTVGSGSVTDSSGAISFGDENLTTTGIVTAAGTSVFTNLDISGDIDVDGTTNLDVVDIDGAVDMASTLQVDSAATFSSTVNTNNDVVIAKSSTGVPSLTLSGFAGASSPYSIINFYNSDGSQQGPNNAAQIKALAINSDGSGGSLDFHTSTGTSTEGADATKKVTIGGGGAFTTFPSAGQPAAFNEDGVDVDFRVESDTNAHAFYVDGASGNVSIGSSTAYGTSKLTLFAATNPTTASSSAIQLSIGEASQNSSYSLKVGYILIGGGYVSSIQSIAGGNPTNLLLNADGGNVLVGATSNASNQRLHVESAGTYGQIGLRNSGATAGKYWNVGAQSNNTFLIYNNGVAGVYLTDGATSWTGSSDENLKENIVELTGVLDKVKDFRCVEYNLISDETNSKKIGFIAQDWQEDYSQVVSQDENGNLGMQYTETIPVLLKAIQEQQALIESLTARITALES
jgi:hypothetical protein